MHTRRKYLKVYSQLLLQGKQHYMYRYYRHVKEQSRLFSNHLYCFKASWLDSLITVGWGMYIYGHVHMHTHIHVCTYVHTYVCTYVCTCTWYAYVCVAQYIPSSLRLQNELSPCFSKPGSALARFSLFVTDLQHLTGCWYEAHIRLISLLCSLIWSWQLATNVIVMWHRRVSLMDSSVKMLGSGFLQTQ